VRRDLRCSGLELLNIAEFPWLHHIPSLRDVSMDIKACTLPKAVKLYKIKLNNLNEMKLH
jgi:hypothetical protein